MFLAGIVGARLFYVIQKWEEFHADNPRELLMKITNAANGGLVVYGSVIGGLLAAFLFLRRHKLPALAIADLIAPSMVLGLALGRLGCLMNGCCYGGACDLPWAVSFPQFSSPYQEDPSPPYYDQLTSGWLHGVRIEPNAEDWPYVTAVVPGSPAAEALNAPTDEAGRLTTPWRVIAINGRVVQGSPGDEEAPGRTPMDDARLLLTASGPGLHLITEHGEAGWTIGEIPQASRPVHPTQIYSSINAFLLCLLVLAVYPYRRRDGEVMALLLVLYGITRFLLEMIRTDEGAIFGTGLTISQNVSLLIIVFAVVAWLFYIRRQPTQLALPPRGPPRPRRRVRRRGSAFSI